MQKTFLSTLTIIVAIVTLFIVKNKVSASYVNHQTTPTELRGTWYQYAGKNKWNKTIVNKHSVEIIIYDSSSKKYHRGGFILKHHNLDVTFYNSKKHVYSFYVGECHANSSSEYWLSKQKVHGKRVMKSYYNSGCFDVYTKNKIKHNYNYVYDKSDYISKIGE